MLSYHGIKIQSTKTAIACLFSMALLSLWPSLGSGTPALPALPQATIDTTYSPPTTGNTITVNAGGNFRVGCQQLPLCWRRNEAGNERVHVYPFCRGQWREIGSRIA